MGTIQCKAEMPHVEGLTDNELTVGREFILACEGDFPKDLVQEKLHFVLKPENKYMIHFLRFEFRSQTAADITATSYVPGNINFNDLQISDGQQTVSLGPIQFAVQSVLPQQTPGQEAVKQEPYGPIGPATLSVPPIYWVILLAVIGLAILVIVAKVVRVMQRRNMLAKLKEHDSAMTPLAQFHQTLRRMQRSNGLFSGGQADRVQIEQCLLESYGMLKLFLTRQYRVPALEWNSRLVLKDLKKYQKPVYEEFGPDLENLYKEFERGIKDIESLKEHDILTIVKHCRLLVEKMERA